VRRAAGLFGGLLVVLILLGVERPRGLGDVIEVRHWSYPDYTRIVVETTRPVKLKSEIHRLGPNQRANRPERLYVDLGGLWVGRKFSEGIKLGDGLLQGVRLGQNTLTTTRVVLDLQNYERHRMFTLPNPHRVVIDVYGRRSPAGRDAPARRLPADRRSTKTVVIDPGHGGRDPGALGLYSVREKDVTLKLAKSLGSKLELLGFEVLFTRKSDRTMRLEERTAIAEAARADLFVSIHANAAPRRSVNGIETYYLDKNHERHSLTVAARENGVSRDQMNDLQKTLAKLRVSELSGYSRHLADLVQAELVGGLPYRYRVKDLGVKKGPFYVLFLSDTPAILVEAGFVTNKTEAKRLRSDAYLEALADRIAKGVARYRDSGERVAGRGAS
jgi:N-acetylmuramoyl-L-alanine amidase